MPSDYQNIQDDNIRRRGVEFDDMGIFISEKFYADKSHFIFELLQNAEDALERRSRSTPGNRCSSAVRFLLYKDRLEFRHFGQPFDENDVKAISDILLGTKDKDGSQIGKFGIGFKSVYAFTASPRIHSGDENFVIERFIRPKAIERISETSDGETVFIFPFDHRHYSPESAHQLIADKLRRLGASVLLFLNQIDKIEYYIDDTSEKGQYLKEKKEMDGAHRVNLVGYDSVRDQAESWLVFASSPKPDSVQSNGRIQIAFRIEQDPKEKQERIVKVDSSPLVAYFPTYLETCLGFLIQGPYLTTPPRDNILRDDEKNSSIIRSTAEMTVAALNTLKSAGLLTASFLETLPITANDFPQGSIFYPIFAQVKKAFLEQDLLPADDGAFVSARNAKLASAEWLHKLLRDEQLRLLFKTEAPLKWISGEVTEGAKHDLWKYIREELQVEEVTPDSFARRVTKEFFTKQADEWMVSFYKFVGNQKALWRLGSHWEPPGPLRAKEFVRLCNDSHVSPFDHKNLPRAYLSLTGEPTIFPIVKPSLIQDDDVLKFLRDLGMPDLDIVAEVIESLLPKYGDSSAKIPIDEHLRDMKRIETALLVDSIERSGRLIAKLRETFIVFAENATGTRQSFRLPCQTYFSTEELRNYFEGNSDGWFVSSIYPESLPPVLKLLGITDQVRVYGTNPGSDGHVIIADDYARHERGLNCFDPGCSVDGLDIALSNPTLKKSLFIWNNLVHSLSDCIRGSVEKSTRQNYENSRKEEQVSQEFGKLLIETPWLPDAEGRFRKPCEMKLEELSASFNRDEDLAQKLGMLRHQWAALADEAGIPVEYIELIKQNPDVLQELKSSIAARKNRPVFPMRTSTDPDRRRERLSAQHFDALNKTYEQREKSVRTSHGAIDPSLWLTHIYTNDDNQMVCQICKEEMPFKKRDGEYYFEAVEALSREILHKEHEEQFLALCPLCAAMYKEFVRNDKDAMLSLKTAILQSNKPEIMLQLGDVTVSLRFVDIHFQDLKTILAGD